jgi:hypothetical protein
MIGARTSQMAIMQLPNPDANTTPAASANLNDAGHGLPGAMRSPSEFGPTA